MKLPIQLLLVLTFILVPAMEAGAQFAGKGPEVPPHSQIFFPNMDTDIAGIRNNGFPTCRFHADDYIQYSPAAVLLLTKACGYQGRSSWGRMLSADAFSAVIMAALVNGMKYTVKRGRPDNSQDNSFPSGHTATAFTLATMLHMEYGWRSPWFSIGGYTVAAATAVMRLANGKHWMSDTFAGALIGIGSVHLGYLINDLIFKDRYQNKDYIKPVFAYDNAARIYDFDLIFSRRFVIGSKKTKSEGQIPERGSSIAINAFIPVIPRAGVTIRTGAGSMENANVYNALAGGYWNLPFAKRFQTEVHLMAGYAAVTVADRNRMDLVAGTSVACAIDNSFKLKVFAEYENICSFQKSLPVNSVLLGFSSGFYF